MRDLCGAHVYHQTGKCALCHEINTKNLIKRNPSHTAQDQPKKPSDAWFPQPLQPSVYAG